MKDCKVALIQMDSQTDREANLDEIERLAREAASQGADLIVFPETAEYIGLKMRKHASQVPGPLTDRFEALAKECGCWIHFGSITEQYREKARNLSLVYSPEGILSGSYRKLHLFDVEIENGPSQRESDAIEPGDALTTVQTDMGILGLSICYDLRFPIMYQKLADLGAEILVVSANFTDPTGQAHWEPLLRARAIENTCYVLACCQCGEKEAFKAHGNSMVIDPWGRIIGRLAQEPGILYAELSAELLESCRRQIPCLKNRRRDIE